MPRENYLPPPPIFLVYAYSLVISAIFFLFVHNQDAVPCVLPPPTFLMFSLNALVVALTTLATIQGNNRKGPLIRILFPHFHGRKNRGRDVWQALELNPIIFWYMTGETPETLETIVVKIYIEVTAPRHFPRTPRTNRRCPCIFDVRNRVLLVIVWLRQYLKLHVLAHIFGISKSTVAEEICYVVPILFVNF